MQRRDNKRQYNIKQIKQIKNVYLIAAVTWIFGCFLLRAYKAPNAFGVVILLIPLVLYGIAYTHVPRITRHVEDHASVNNLLVIAVVFLTVLFEVSHRRKHHNTIYIMLVALILIIVSMDDVWMGKRAFAVIRHVKSAARTAALTLLIYVIYVGVVDRLPMKNFIVLQRNDAEKSTILPEQTPENI